MRSSSQSRNRHQVRKRCNPFLESLEDRQLLNSHAPRLVALTPGVERHIEAQLAAQASVRAVANDITFLEANGDAFDPGSFSPSSPTIILVPGWKGDPLEDSEEIYIQEAVSLQAQNPFANVLIVDTRPAFAYGASLNIAAQSIPIVAEKIGEFISSYQLKPESISIYGFSLGAEAALEAAPSGVGRLVLEDPPPLSGFPWKNYGEFEAVTTTIHSSIISLPVHFGNDLYTPSILNVLNIAGSHRSSVLKAPKMLGPVPDSSGEMQGQPSSQTPSPNAAAEALFLLDLEDGAFYAKPSKPSHSSAARDILFGGIGGAADVGSFFLGGGLVDGGLF